MHRVHIRWISPEILQWLNIFFFEIWSFFESSILKDVSLSWDQDNRITIALSIFFVICKLRKLLLSRYYPVIKQFDEMFCLSSSHFLVWFIIYVYCLEHTMPKFISLPNRQQLACSMVFLYFSCSNKTNIGGDLLLLLVAENTYLYSK